ncbi:MAG TPA: CBO0543 family protein, partial [Desulfosporosinus sp.]|nr:CBO0543 family protein [Desulfosporosinus sp.]
IWILSAYKWSDWRNWKSYYPTILFFIVGDLIYNFVAYNHPLWELTSPRFGTTFSVLIMNATLWPASTLLFLTHFPFAGNLKKALYILIWVAIFTLVELFFSSFSYLKYSNGWNIGWSILFNTVMFPLLKIHHEKPQLAWPLAFLFGTIVIYFFDIALSSMK